MNPHIDIKLLDFTKINDKIKISTISGTCKLNVNILLENIYNYIELDIDNIVTVKYKGLIKSLLKLKKKRKKKKKRNAFQNQLTLEIIPDKNLFPNNKISVKLFKNGSIQMAGIKSLEACNYVLNKLIDTLKKEYGIVNETNTITDIKFIDDIDGIKITNFKIDMINSNFNIGFRINRETLYNIIILNKIQCSFEPSIHACVNIKILPKKAIKNVSIFVFQSGNVIITGAKNVESIIEAYDFIIMFLNKHKKNIIQNEVSESLLLKINKNNLLNKLNKNNIVDILLND